MPGRRKPVEFWDCPRNLIPERLQRFLRAFPAFERGLLWYPGPIGQQPSRYVRAMDVIGDEAERIRAAEREVRRLRDGSGGRRSRA